MGTSSLAVPAYIAEITTAHNRGRLGALYQFTLVFGILQVFFNQMSGVKFVLYHAPADPYRIS